ncbi:hypothetical protein B0H14DRAFT_2721280 [Mycena olivaceomarginata]|nr:hypothetical protein B0H14DRAFT_2721280 [Mycena olivaceomarginata]
MESETPLTLPAELERVIFELAAWQDPKSITTLILVAKRICIWIEPQLYRIVLSTGSTDQLLQMMRSKPPEFLREHVHHLAFSAPISRSDVARILSICTNVHDLAVWTGDTYPDLLSDMRNLPNLRRLSTCLSDLFGGPDQFRLPPIEELPFSHLTHLDVFGDMPAELWPVFGMLPCLTHLSFSDNYTPEMIQMALDTCAALHFLVIVWMDSLEFEALDTSAISDPRFCTIECVLFKDDWKEGASGGLDFWLRADMERKSRRERPGSS